MGLILGEKEDDEPVILTDILGLEDALGTMDFKVFLSHPHSNPQFNDHCMQGFIYLIYLIYLFIHSFNFSFIQSSIQVLIHL